MKKIAAATIAVAIALLAFQTRPLDQAQAQVPALSPSQGGTGTTTVPGLDQILIGNASGKYIFINKSALTGAGGGASNWLLDGNGRLTPSTTIDVALTNFRANNGTTTSATSSALTVSSYLNLFGTKGTSLPDFCVGITGGSGLCDGTDDVGAGGDGVSNWLFNGTRLTPSTTAGIGVFASSTISDLSVTNGTTTNATSTNLRVSTLLSATYASTTALSASGNIYSTAGKFQGPATTEIWNTGAGSIRFILNSGAYYYFDPTEVRIPKSSVINWRDVDAITGNASVGLARNADGILEVNSGTAGTLRDLTARSGFFTATSTAPSLGFVNATSSGSTTLNMLTIYGAANLGTPATLVLTNATGLPVGTGITGLGTGVATALAVNTGSAGAFVVNGGALGTPSSGTVTNLTGTASININGTVGATTPTTGVFTYASTTGISGTNLTFTNGVLTYASTTGATASNLTVLSGLNLFGGGNVATANALCVQLTGHADLCDGGDATGAGGGSNWLYNGSRLTPSTTVGIGVFASSTIGGGTDASGLTVNGGATTTRLFLQSSLATGAEEYGNYPFTLVNTNGGAAGLFMATYHNSASPAFDDELSKWDIYANDSGGNVTRYGAIQATAKSALNGAERGQISFGVIAAGAFSYVVDINGESLMPRVSNGLQLGSTTRQFADLFLAEGGVINWDNGDMTATQANDVLTIAGGNLTTDYASTTGISGSNLSFTNATSTTLRVSNPISIGPGTFVLTATSTKSFTLASTTPDASGKSFNTATTTQFLQFASEATTLLGWTCQASSTGSVSVRFGDGSGNWTNSIACNTTATFTLATSNNTFTAREIMQVQVGSTASSPGYVFISTETAKTGP